MISADQHVNGTSNDGSVSLPYDVHIRDQSCVERADGFRPHHSQFYDACAESARQTCSKHARRISLNPKDDAPHTHAYMFTHVVYV